MGSPRGTVAAITSVLVAALAGCPAPHAPTAPAPPRLVVLIVVDQLAAWTFEQRRPLFKHGLARLLREGVYWPRATYPYAYTYTAPGHAALATGAPPSATGIIGNTWYRRADGVARPAEYDPDAAIVFQPGAVPDDTFGPDDGASGKPLRVPGIADALRAASRDSRSVAISLKARSACFVAGVHPDLALWFQEVLGSFTTSTAYRSAVPLWVSDLARDRPWTRFATAAWTASDPELLARETGIADDAPGEGSQHGFTPRFPHDLGSTKEPARALLLTPFADEMLTEIAIAALAGERLGDDAAPDLLAVSYSSHDFAAHVWGPGSWEELDLLLRFDRELDRLLDALDAKLGPDGYAVVLTSDHGATPLVERSPYRGARRISLVEIEDAAEAAIAKLVGPGDWVAAISAQNVYLSRTFAELPDAARRDDAIQAAVDAIRLVPGVQDAGRLAPLAAACPPGEMMAAICASYAPGESGDIYLVPVRGSLITEYRDGTHHDAPTPDDQVVPLIVRVPGIPARTSYEAVSILRVAPTLAKLLGVPAPAAAHAPALELAITPAKNGE